jgi:arylsulfatase A
MRFLRFLIIPILACLQASAEVEKPNILFILTDDLGAADLACTGSDLYRTPNLDKLAAQGVTFTRAYSSAHVCSPTRAALQTGKTPARLHLTDWLRGHLKPYAKLRVPDWTMGLPSSELSFAKVLQPQGYSAGWFGKWHAGENARELGYTAGHEDWNENRKDDAKDPKGVFTLNRQAMEFIEKNGDKPFFIGLSHYSPHGPVRFDPTLRDDYQKIIDANPGLRQKNAGYAAMIEALDASIGEMLDFLDKKKLAKNTLVIFTSDNGGELNFTNNAPLRMGKGSFYEGGIRVPVIARWPGHIKPGSTNETRVSSIDFLPTLAVLSGAAVPEDIDGKDLSAAFSKGEAIHRGPLYWHYPHYHATRPSGAILNEDWKLIEWFETGKTELYNLKEDPFEQKDLSADHPDKAASLLTELKEWRKSVGAQMMEPNPAYDPERETQGPEKEKKENKKEKKNKKEPKGAKNPKDKKAPLNRETGTE